MNEDFFSYFRWLKLNSFNRFLYVGFNGANKGRRGCPTNESHAVVVSNGFVCDSAFSCPMPLDAYFSKYNHKSKIIFMIMVDSPSFKVFEEK